MNPGNPCVNAVDWPLSEALSDCLEDTHGQLDLLDVLATLMLHTNDRVRALLSEREKANDAQR